MFDRPRLNVVCRAMLRDVAVVAVTLVLLAGCGTTQQSMATQQLLESDAVDAAVAQIDFSPLSGHQVYFDTAYIQDYKGIGFVNSSYVISGLRQQILAAGCELQESKDKAEFVIEGRLGTLGSDEHNVVYGIPKNNAINSVASAVPGSPSLPSIPELALAKKVSSQGAAKLALFAYHRESREPVWQSGLALARSSARDTWFMGIGPLQSGTIHRDKVRFAGRRVNFGLWPQPEGLTRGARFASYESGAVFTPQTDAAATETMLADHAEANPEPQALPATADASPIAKPATPEIVPVSHEAEAKSAPPPTTPPVTEDPPAPAATAKAPTAPSPAGNAEPAPFPGASDDHPPLPPVQATMP
ncbi:MAG: DUF6655 family protein [Planctomycetaceae bacterium]